MDKLSKKQLTDAVLLSSEAIGLLVELTTKLVAENQRIRKQLSDLTHEVLATQHDLEILKMFILKD
jgi:hypothetical protein